MAGKLEKATHQDATDFEGPVETGDAHAKRPADKKGVGDKEFDNSANKDKGTVFPSGKVSESAIRELFAGVEGLSEDFFKKVATLIEGALSEKIEEISENFRTQYEEKLEAVKEEIASELEESYGERISAYIDYTVSTFMEENKVGIDMGIKQDIAEQVMSAVATIVESAGVQLPDEKVDVAEALAEELVTVERTLNETVSENINLKNLVEQYQLKEAFGEVAHGLSDVKKDRLARLAENISYESIEDFTSKVSTLRESIDDSFVAPKPETTSELNEEVTLTETTEKKVDDRMAAYIRVARGG